MGRPPNFNTSQWYIRPRGQSWVDEAHCAKYFDFPWTAEQQPDDVTLFYMAEICDECPVKKQCARYALSAHGGHGIDGGFYAGVWIPWINDNRRTQLVRQRARRELKRTVTQDGAESASCRSRALSRGR